MEKLSAGSYQLSVPAALGVLRLCRWFAPRPTSYALADSTRSFAAIGIPRSPHPSKPKPGLPGAPGCWE